MYEQQPDSQLRRDPVQAVTGNFLWPLLVKTWNLTRSKENSGTESYGVPTRQGNYKIFPGNDQLPQQVLCTQCTPRCTSQCTHTSGHRLQTRQIDYNPADRCFQERTQSMFNPEGKSHMLCFQGPHQD